MENERKFAEKHPELYGRLKQFIADSGRYPSQAELAELLRKIRAQEEEAPSSKRARTNGGYSRTRRSKSTRRTRVRGRRKFRK